MQFDYYIASSTRNKPQIAELTSKLRAKGKTVFSFIESDPLQKPIAEEVSPKNWREDPRTQFIFEKDMVPLINSEKLVLLLPAGKSAHIESGVAYGLGKECFVIGEVEETDSLYLIFKEDYQTIDEFIDSLD